MGALGLVWRFLVHIFFGTLLFVGVGVPVVGLDFLMRFLADRDIPYFMLTVGSALEYLVFCVDAILYALFCDGRRVAAWSRNLGETKCIKKKSG